MSCHLDIRAKHIISENTKKGDDNINTLRDSLFFEAGIALGIETIEIAKDGVQNRKKKTNDHKTDKITAVLCSLIMPPIPIASVEPM